MRFLLVEAAQGAARSLPQWRSEYFHLTMRRGKKTAKVAMARRQAVRFYWMMCKEWDYQQVVKFGSHAEQPGNRHGVNPTPRYEMGILLLLREEFEVVIRIAGATVHASDRASDLKLTTTRALVWIGTYYN